LLVDGLHVRPTRHAVGELLGYFDRALTAVFPGQMEDMPAQRSRQQSALSRGRPTANKLQ
jgi:hypothetical protein